MAILNLNATWHCTTEEAKKWLARVVLDVLDNLSMEVLDGTGLWELASLEELEKALESLGLEVAGQIFGDAVKRLLE